MLHIVQNYLEAEPVVAHNAQEAKPDATLVPEPAPGLHSTVAEVVGPLRSLLPSSVNGYCQVVQDVPSVESMSEPDRECTPGPILEDASLPLDGVSNELCLLLVISAQHQPLLHRT